jgi:hypothetical protein
MADALRVGTAASGAAVSQHGHAGRSGRRHAGPAFRHVLASAMANGHIARTAGLASPVIQPAIQAVSFHVPQPGWHEKPTSVIPAGSDAALMQAMTLEGVPQSWQDGLRFIMAQESGGQVNIKNPVHSARGLFQLTAAQYHLNPNGAGSFGNAVEEAQGGIRYIHQRYGTADNAVAFWRQHHWY